MRGLFALLLLAPSVQAVRMGVEVSDLETTSSAHDSIVGATLSAPSVPINAMQWSPHWKCFTKAFFKDTCQPLVEELLSGSTQPAFHTDDEYSGREDAEDADELASTPLKGWLRQYTLDFVNLGMFTDTKWERPANYDSFDAKCMSGLGPDNVKFLYDNTKWAVAPWQLDSDRSQPEINREVGQDRVEDADEKLELERMQTVKVHNPVKEDMFGCSNMNGYINPVTKVKEPKPDRVYGVVAFERIDSEEKVIVVVGHLPHPPFGSSSSNVSVAEATGPVLRDHMGAKIAHIKNKGGGWENAQVLLIADLNNDIEDFRDPVFDNAEKINKAFDMMDPKAVAGVKGMKGQIRGADENPLPHTVGEALAVPNLGWTKAPFMSNDEVWHYINLPDSLNTDFPLGSFTEPMGTCCADKPAIVDHQVPSTNVHTVQYPGFPYAFDRIMTSFGSLETLMPLEELLKWSHADDRKTLIKTLFVGAFHMPIIAKIG